MDSVSLNQFWDGFQDCVDRVIDQHSPLKVTSDRGSDFVVVSAEDWEQLQETLYVLQNSDLMQQIVRSSETHNAAKGYQPSTEEIDEILSI